MNKQNNLAYLTLLLVGLFSLFSINISAQNKVIAEAQTPSATDKVLQNYIHISSLSMDERRTFFNDKLSPADRANIFKFHLAFQFVKRPNLNEQQKDLILESISMITPDIYDEKKPQKRTDTQQQANVLEQKIKTLFSRQEGYEIFASLGGTKEDGEILNNYQTVMSSKFSIDRKESFLALAAKEKSVVMKTHLALQSANRNLNKEQIQFVIEILNTLSPELFSQQKNPVEQKKLEGNITIWQEKTLILFEAKDAFEIFYSFGGEVKKEGNTSNIQTDPLCSCSNSADIFSTWQAGSHCETGGCKSRNLGCGWVTLQACTGLCYQN